MKAHEAVIVWTPRLKKDRYLTKDYSDTIGKVRIEKGGGAWTLAYSHSGGACMATVEAMRGIKSIVRVFIDFHTVVVRDGIDPQVAHAEFLKIDEYAEHMSPDIRGARGPGARAVKRGELLW
jgi:hypothetical protein